MGHPFMPPASSHNLKAAGPGPIGQIGCKGRLVAIGHRIDHPGLPGSSGQPCPAKGIGFNRDINNVFFGGKGRTDMFYRCQRIAGNLDNDLNPGVVYRPLPIIADANGFACQRVINSAG